MDKIHKNKYTFLIIPIFSSKSYFVDIIAHFRSWQKENSSEIPARGIYRSVKLFLQPIKLREISIMMRSWNYKKLTVVYLFYSGVPQTTCGRTRCKRPSLCLVLL